MQPQDAPKRKRLVFVTVIFAAVLIDAFLLAHVHAQFIHDHGYDLRPRHAAVAKPAPP
jgi:hypothetical protein